VVERPTGMVIEPSALPSIRVGVTQQFQAVLTLDDGTSPTSTTEVSWISSNALVASVSTPGGGGRVGGGGGGSDGIPDGLATGIGAGAATATATYLGVSGTATFTVSTATFASIFGSGSATDSVTVSP